MKIRELSIRYTIFACFTITALVASLLISISLYQRFSNQVEKIVFEDNKVIVSQTARSVEGYIRSALKLSDSIYYGILKNNDIDSKDVSKELKLLYDNNQDNVDKIAVFYQNGSMYTSVPYLSVRKSADVIEKSWFKNALAKTENQHFSMPYIQDIFVNNNNTHKWVLTLSRYVELTKDNSTYQGVLMIDLNYSGLEHLFEGINFNNDSYICLINNDGKIIYHPNLQLIFSDYEKENNDVIKNYSDGNHIEDFNNVRRLVTVKTIGYTGWKIVFVTPSTALSLNNIKTFLLLVFIVSVILSLLILINSYISSKITEPIQELEKSVIQIESGDLDAKIYQGGSYEIRHLGKSINNMKRQIKGLMQDIINKSEAKRKQEFDILQSQINPHFLYNTLDIIVWMVENEQKQEAVKVVTALARFFRISLSKGKNIIKVSDEVEHVKNYLMIQNMRFKNRFIYEINLPNECEKYQSLKLMLQPIVENAIYHGMEFMDGDGLIKIDVYLENNLLYFRIEDNGLGMSEEMVDSIMENKVVSKKGSGIGIRNVNERIKIYFGAEYGFNIKSELDEGTVVTIVLPAIEYKE